MRVRDESLLALTLALRDQATATAAIDTLAGNPATAAVEGMLEVVLAGAARVPGAAPVQAAAAVAHPLVPDALTAGMQSRFAPARLPAIQAAHRRGILSDELRHIIVNDPSWPNRRAAVLALGDRPDNGRWAVLDAADDP